MQSQYGRINWRDAGKGFLITFGGAFLPSIALTLQAGTLPDEKTFLTLLGASLSAGITYIFMNIFTNSENKLGKKEPDKI